MIFLCFSLCSVFVWSHPHFTRGITFCSFWGCPTLEFWPFPQEHKPTSSILLLPEAKGVRKGCKWGKRKHSFQSLPGSVGVTLQPKRDLLGHRGDALPPRLMTELINSPNTMPFWAIDTVSFEIFKTTKYGIFFCFLKSKTSFLFYWVP